MNRQPRSRAAGDRARSRDAWMRDLVSLTKPRITLMVCLSAGAGYFVGAGGAPGLGPMLVALAGIGLVAGGTSAWNQVLERDVDARMERTRGRPLPAGRLHVRTAAAFATGITALGVGLLWLQVNRLTALLALVAIASYVGIYTPLKRRSSLATLVGAVPGALPIAGGWAAARGELGPGAWALFGILFFWQLPHFLALAWMYREDYRRGGLRMLSVTDPGGSRTRAHSVLYAAALLPASLLPIALGLSGAVYGAAALALTMLYLGAAVRFALRADSPAARGLFRVSLLYLPLLLVVLTLDHGPRRVAPVPVAAAAAPAQAGEPQAPVAEGGAVQRDSGAMRRIGKKTAP